MTAGQVTWPIKLIHWWKDVKWVMSERGYDKFPYLSLAMSQDDSKDEGGVASSHGLTRKNEDPSLLYDSIREIVTGSISGAVAKVVEYPFDTVKVRMQYSQSLDKPLYTNSWDCIRTSYRQDGFVKGFYRGLLAPMGGAAMEISTLFFSYNFAQDLIKMSRNDKKELSQTDKLICGAFSGLCTSFVLTPIELIKCRMQVETIRHQSKTLPQIVSSVVSEHGVKGLWKGANSTILREVGGSIAWFGNYEFTLGLFSGDDPNYQFKPYELMTAGAMAGIGYNCAMFPIDTVKSIYQITDGSQSPLQIASRIWRTKGITGFYSGLGVTLCKTVPASSVLFLSYEYIKAMW